MTRAAIEYRPPANLVAYARNARTHSRKQVRQIADSIRHFGFTNPVLVGDDDTIIAGHGRVEAAKLLGLPEVPTIKLSGMSEADRRAYVLADNKLALNAGWDTDLQAMELQALIDLDFDIELTGFSTAEIDLCFDMASASDPDAVDRPEDTIPALPAVAISRPGDIWLCGRHRLICGDARDENVLASLMGDQHADMMFTDPPYNVAIDGHVCGSGSVRHREFAMASGEMDKSEFIAFLLGTLGPASGVLRDGAIAYVCMDWRHMDELLTAGGIAFDELKNLIVWNKTNGGMGSFYRSKHELIFAFKKGKAAHTNNFGLGDTGRYRTNVWDYPGISSIGSDRDASLAMHPTVKPVDLVADAIRDCSKRGQIILDCFGGSGTTLIAAETTGRSARLIEYDPLYCDTIVQRWETLTGKLARLDTTDTAFEDVRFERSM